MESYPNEQNGSDSTEESTENPDLKRINEATTHFDIDKELYRLQVKLGIDPGRTSEINWENEAFAHEDSFAPTTEEKEKATASLDTEETGLSSIFTEEELEHRRLMAEELKDVQRYNMHKEGFLITEDIADSLIKGGGIISYSKDQSDIKERHIKLTR